MWDYVGMSRTKRASGAALDEIPKLRDEFWRNVSVPGTPDNLNQSLENAGRVADYLEFAELLAWMRSTGANRAAAISAKRARRPRAKRFATMRTMRTSPRGSSRAWARRRSCTRSRSTSRKCTRRRGATSRIEIKGVEDRVTQVRLKTRIPSKNSWRLNLRIWRQAGRRPAPGRLPRRSGVARHVVPRNARRRQRGIDQKRRRRDRVRLRLP